MVLPASSEGLSWLTADNASTSDARRGTMERMLPILTLAVLVYSGAGAEPNVGSTARARLIEALPASTRVVEHALEAALSARREGWRSVDELGFLAEGRAALVAGHKARERVELDEAARHLAQAEAAFTEGLMYAGVASLAAEAALEYGVTLGELGRADEARIAFRRALALWPGAQLTEKTARPDVVRSFREVQKAHAPQAAPTAAPPDVVATRIEALRHAPDPRALAALADAVAADAVLVTVVSADGKHLLVARVQATCATEPVEVSLNDRGNTREAIARVLDAHCTTGAPALSTDDPRLAPSLVVTAPRIVARVAPRRKTRIWPIALAGALGVGAAILGVTIAFVASDARYAVKVDGASFGAR